MNGKRITDPVHGTVQLNDLETQVVSTRAFQRLRGIKHLGLAHLVFPGADYSRFSHGIGTMYVTGLILDELDRVTDALTPADLQLYRLAALLHDIGHYPFSHTFEHALRDYNASTNLIAPVASESVVEREIVIGEMGSAGLASSESGSVWMHEEVGQKVLALDPELNALLENNDIDTSLLSRIIERVEPPKFANLISSDLDADRTDYLMRTAMHTGLPYGNVDLAYLASQVRLDNSQRICFTPKAMRAAEHLLLGRYFDYQQVSFHKTVAGMEKVLNSAVAVLLDNQYISCTQRDIEEKIRQGDWYFFDDGHIMSRVRKAHRELPAGPEREILYSILARRPPKMLADWEALGKEESDGRIYRLLKRVLEEKLRVWTKKYDVPMWIWDKNGTTLTKISSHVPVSEYAGRGEPDDKVEQAVRILRDDGDSTPLQEMRSSLLRVLGDYGLYSIRVYALVDRLSQADRSAIASEVRAEFQAIK